MACVVRACGDHTSKRALMCSKHWHMLPKALQIEIRKGTEKGNHTLRAQPTREWIAAVSKIVGDVRTLVFRVDAGSKVSRKFQSAKPETVPA